MKEKIKNIIISAIDELNEQLNDKEKIEYSEDLSFVGENACLDSISLVTFITIAEELLEDEFDKTISIVSKSTFSCERSPFLSITALCDFIEELISKE